MQVIYDDLLWHVIPNVINKYTYAKIYSILNVNVLKIMQRFCVNWCLLFFKSTTRLMFITLYVTCQLLPIQNNEHWWTFYL